MPWATQLGGSLALQVALAAVLLAALLAVLRQLRRSPALRDITPAYVVGALALCGAIAVQALARSQGSALGADAQHILDVVLIFSWGAVALRLVEHALVTRWSRRTGVAVPQLAREIVRAVAFIAGVLLALQLLFNIAPSSIVISSTVLSAVLGLALQDLLRNVIAGVALQVERPFDIGHWVQVGDAIGRVVEMSWRATRVVTVDGNYIVFPNSDLANARVVNYTLPEPRQAMHAQVSLSHSHPPNLVKRVLAEAALASPFVASDPPPSIKVQAYGDYSVTYDIKFWIYDYDRYPDKRDTVMTNVWYALHRAGLSLSLPVRELHHIDHSQEMLEARRQAHLRHVREDLRRAAVLDALDERELGELAERIHVRIYGAGDVLVRQGDPGDTLFILRSGLVRVDVRGEGGAAVTVNRLGAGECFGETALMTGAPRGATVTAEDDSEVLLVAKGDIAPLLQANPTLPERLAALLSERQEQTRAALERHRAAGEPAQDPTPRLNLVARIRQFFGLADDGGGT